MEEETKVLINKKIRELLENGSINSMNLAIRLIETINNPLIESPKNNNVKLDGSEVIKMSEQQFISSLSDLLNRRGF